jgi:antitoxin (DNA-binding transcriptional repressor) of toxin-antitoxin stability system
MTIVVDIEEMQAGLDKLIQAVKDGKQIVITDDKVPFAVLIPLAEKTVRKFGALKGKFAIGKEFFEPLPEDELALWE